VTVVTRRGHALVCHCPRDVELLYLDRLDEMTSTHVLLVSRNHEPRVLNMADYRYEDFPVCFNHLPVYPFKEGSA
jgi:hypothetical protein